MSEKQQTVTLRTDIFIADQNGKFKWFLQPETLARVFHDTYERMAPGFGYETREETRQFDPETPNGELMIAVCENIIDRLTVNISTEFTGEAPV